MAVDAAGNIFMGDFGAHLSRGPIGTRVWRITPTGEASIFAEGLRGASGNTFDRNGDLLQANIGGNTISRVHPDGTVRELATEGFRNPVGVAISPGGVVHVANCGDNTIVAVGSSGIGQRVVADSLLKCPNGLAFAPNGDMFVSNFYNGDVVRIGNDGNVERFATLPGDNNGHITFGNGRLYVAARTANQLYEVGLDGSIVLLAGTGVRGLADGPARQATLSLPNDIALSPDGGILYWNDVGIDSEDPQVLSPTFVRFLTLSE